jgi:hypothetical protein
MDNPLTEKDVITAKDTWRYQFEEFVALSDVQSAKRLLKMRIMELYIHPDLCDNILKMIDTCFQIDEIHKR